MGFGNSNGNSGSSSTTKGGSKFYCDEVEITRVVPYRNEQHKGGFQVDLGVEAFWNVTKKDGGSFEKSMLITIKEDYIDKLGWMIDRLWESAGASSDWEPTSEGYPPEEALRDLIGRNIKVLRYPDNKGYHSEWDRPFAPGTPDVDMIDQFLKSYNDRGYPKNYANGQTDAPATEPEEEYIPF